MDRLRFFVKIFGITFMVVGVGLLVFSSKDKVGKVAPSAFGVVSKIKLPETDFSLPDVLGARTQKAGDISKAVSSDIGDGVEAAKKQALNIKIGDIINIVSRAQKIPQDAHKVGDYVREQADNMLKSK
jgi:hypothetical protein